MDVVIFDDDAAEAELLTEVLRAKGYSTEKFLGGARALEEIKRLRPRLVITDVMMPQLDGLSLCRGVKTDPTISNTHVVVVSGKRYRDVAEEAKLCGAAAFFGKPIAIDRLREAVDSLLKAPEPAQNESLSQREALIHGSVLGSWSSGLSLDPSLPTSCISLLIEGHAVVLDAGTGLKNLAQKPRKPDVKTAWLFLSGYQNDRIAGLSHLFEAFGPEFMLHAAGPADPRVSLQNLLAKATPPSRAALKTYSVSESSFSLWPGVYAKALFTMHPRTSLAYRIDIRDRSLVYCPNSEYPTGDDSAAKDFRSKFKSFAHGTELLIHDARYLDEDYPGYAGKGHSAPAGALRAAADAGARSLLLINQDSHYSAEKLAAALRGIRERLKASANPLSVEAALPGTVFSL